MSPDEILASAQAKPFRPFRIHTASGGTFDIRHPERLWAGESTLVVFTFISEDPKIFDKWDAVGLSLIGSISFLDAPVAQDQN
ncbi:MAG: hypothetical protein ACREJB_04375 [Planctomycetaceae bacterium]